MISCSMYLNSNGLLPSRVVMDILALLTEATALPAGPQIVNDLEYL